MTNSTTQTTESTPKVADKSLFERVLGVLFSPRETFAAIAAYPRWFGMLALVVIVTAVVTGGFLMTQVGQQAWLDMMEKQGTNPQGMEMMQKIAPYAGYLAIGQIVIFTPIVLLVIAGIMVVVFNVGMGGNATFRQLFAVLTASQAVGLVGAVLKVPLNYVTKSMSASTNLGVFFPMLDDTGFLARVLGMVDLFIVWWVVVLAIGFGVLYKRRTGPIAVGFFVVYALIAVAIAAFQAARS